MTPPCERLWEVDAVRDGLLSAGDADAFARHSRTCAECTKRLEANAQLRRLGVALHEADAARAPRVDDLAARRLRAKILRLAADPRAEGRRARMRQMAWGAVALAVAVGVVAGVRVARGPRGELAPVAVASVTVASSPSTLDAKPLAPAPFAEVTASGDAVWERSVDASVERVRVASGAVAFHVRPLVAGERFLVALPDGEIEVRGTRFDVVVANGHTARIAVTEGVIAFRRDGDAERTLRVNESWAVAPATPAAPTAPRGTTPPPVADVAETPDDYARAVALYAAHHDDEAAALFRSFALAHSSRPEAEDALFLEILALNRAGRGAEAARAAYTFAERLPRSIHARDAAVLAAKPLVREGQCARARAILAGVSPAVGAAARAAALGACESIDAGTSTAAKAKAN